MDDWSAWTTKPAGAIFSPLGSLSALFVVVIILMFSGGFFRRKQSPANAWHLQLNYDGLLFDKRRSIRTRDSSLGPLILSSVSNDRPSRIRASAALALFVDHIEGLVKNISSDSIDAILETCDGYTLFLRSHLALLIGFVAINYDNLHNRSMQKSLSSIFPLLTENQNPFAQYTSLFCLNFLLKNVQIAEKVLLDKEKMDLLLTVCENSSQTQLLRLPAAVCLFRLSCVENSKNKLATEQVIRALFKLARGRDSTVRMIVSYVLSTIAQNKQNSQLLMRFRCDKLFAVLNRRALVGTQFLCARGFSKLPERPNPTETELSKLKSPSVSNSYSKTKKSEKTDKNAKNAKSENENDSTDNNSEAENSDLKSSNCEDLIFSTGPSDSGDTSGNNANNKNSGNSARDPNARKLAKYFVANDDPLRTTATTVTYFGRNEHNRMLSETQRLVDIEMILKLVELTEGIFVKFLLGLRVLESLVREGKHGTEDPNDTTKKTAKKTVTFEEDSTTKKRNKGKTAEKEKAAPKPNENDDEEQNLQQSLKIKLTADWVEYQLQWAQTAKKYAKRLHAGLRTTADSVDAHIPDVGEADD